MMDVGMGDVVMGDAVMPAPRAADVLLADGKIAVIRPLEAEDREGLLALHEEAGDDSVRMRFFSLNRRAAHDYVEHLMRDTGDTVVTLVAVLEGRIVAVGTAERTEATAAEVAFLVSDRQQGQGLGSLLLEHLAAAGRDRGIRRFVAEVLVENAGMMRVFHAAGFEVSRTHESGVVSVEMSTEATVRAVEAADMRESFAEARSLGPLLHPPRSPWSGSAAPAEAWGGRCCARSPAAASQASPTWSTPTPTTSTASPPTRPWPQSPNLSTWRWSRSRRHVCWR